MQRLLSFHDVGKENMNMFESVVSYLIHSFINFEHTYTFFAQSVELRLAVISKFTWRDIGANLSF